jgi:hypothetical protein
VVNASPRPLYPWEREPVPIVQQAGWAPRTVRTSCTDRTAGRMGPKDGPDIRYRSYSRPDGSRGRSGHPVPIVQQAGWVPRTFRTSGTDRTAGRMGPKDGTDIRYRSYSRPDGSRGRSGQPVPIVQQAGWAPRTVRTSTENLAPTGIRSADRPARSESLHGQRYPTPPPPTPRLLSKETNFKRYCIDGIIASACHVLQSNFRRKPHTAA